MDPVFAGQAASLAAGQVINTVSDIFTRAATLAAPKGSLVNIGTAGRVEPLCVVDEQCINLEYISDVLQSVQSIFCGYYLSALRWCISPESVQTLQILNTLNPNRTITLDETYKQLSRNVQTAIGTLEEFKAGPSMALESYKWKLPATKGAAAAALEAEKTPSSGVSFDKDGNDILMEKGNLVIGKLLQVDLQQGNTTIKLPIAVRLFINQLSSRGLTSMMSGGADRKLIERFHSWRSGRISFWKDLVLCQDLINAQKKMMLDDSTGAIGEIVKRAANHTKAGLISGSRSQAEVSNLFIISEDTAGQIENTLGGKFENYNFRAGVMERTNAMIIAVVERDWERVTFYHHGISTSTNVGVRDLKMSNKGSGPDIGDILKSFIDGKQPTL